ncbi:hypothetical protein RJ639_040557 [Escallonia herrerae]|uniref:Non-haem dioxygenase N-terminal domain-containing protein n=1 Tax=Escallonia herrerae TaxID=1293975 RepID=A0AA88WIC5_9ASTE|nr:hypothetical protein RJ639_040557 [Escallonia herrerae]
MASLVSSWSNKIEYMPADFIMPPERRPGNFLSICKEIPLIDLGQAAGSGRAQVVQQIIKAGQEFGFFQVINHGVSEEMMQDTMDLYKEFFGLPAEENASLCTDDNSKSCRLFTSGLNYAKEEVHYWKDTLKHPVLPREAVAAYSTEVRKMGMRLLELIGEGLGLEEGKRFMGFRSAKMGNGMELNPFLMLLLSTFVTKCSNGKLKGAEHRAVLSSSAARTSIATFFSPSRASLIEPAKALVNASNPQKFTDFTYKEFLDDFLSHISNKAPRVGTALTPYELKA